MGVILEIMIDGESQNSFGNSGSGWGDGSGWDGNGFGNGAGNCWGGDGWGYGWVDDAGDGSGVGD